LRPRLSRRRDALSIVRPPGEDPMNQTVEIATPDGVANAYLTRPDGAPHPGVLFIPDAFGLRPAIEEMADHVAAGGYVVLAPNVFYRAGRAPVEELVGPVGGENRAGAFQAVLPLIRELTPERVAADGGAYLGYLEQVAAPGPLGVTGYCMGGRLAWRIAATHPGRVAALAAFHTAGLVSDDPGSTHLTAADLGPVEAYFGFADEDPGATPEQIAVLRQALDAAGVRYTAEVFEGAHHGYAVPDAPAYDEAASERQFRELQTLLRRTLG
jgi:carboxymethylenebutenolidase